MPTADIAILGAGAAGLMCARAAAARGLSVILLDQAAAPGGKIPISGGGRANVTNLHMGPAFYFGNQPEFCAYALDRLAPQDVIRMVQAYGISWEERTHGQIFCREPARKLAGCLAEDCARLGCMLLPRRTVRRVMPESGGFRIETGGGTVRARQCVLALGSPAWPQAGGTDAGWRLARALGHAVIPARPVLTPLLMPPDWPLRSLAGISLPVRITSGGQSFEDDLLFTHHGISGPASLKASALWRPGGTVEIDFLPGTARGALLDAPGSGRLLARTLLSRVMPQRLADALLPEDCARRRTAELSRAMRDRLERAVHACVLRPCGAGGLKKAEACAGGVDTRELNPWSMESLLVPGLYVIGEMVDITGQLGGYNLHWAWASGLVAGESIPR